jgi:hypothetical protein
VNRLVAIPQSREPPPDLLRRLRAIHPRAELVYIGDGEWWVGIVEPNEHRRQTGARILAREWAQDHPDWGVLRMGALLVQGFSYCGSWVFDGEPTAKLVHDFAEADWMWREQQRAVEQLVLEGPTQRRARTARAHVKAAHSANGRWVVRRILQGRRPVYGYAGAPCAPLDRRAV